MRRRNTRGTRFDRGLPGEGVIGFPGLIEQLRATGFDGPLDVEVLSALEWWKADPDQTASAIVDWFTGMSSETTLA